MAGVGDDPKFNKIPIRRKEREGERWKRNIYDMLYGFDMSAKHVFNANDYLLPRNVIITNDEWMDGLMDGRPDGQVLGWWLMDG